LGDGQFLKKAFRASNGRGTAVIWGARKKIEAGKNNQK
jgi:hypothetical protein